MRWLGWADMADCPLPPPPCPQLEKFKREAECARLGIPYVDEAVEATKLTSDNVGFAMLKKSGMGVSERAAWVWV